MGCPQSGCTGYELTDNLDFDTNGNGRADAGDTYWNRGRGWEPIGKVSRHFSATFEGNKQTISNLYIDWDSIYLGLFGVTGNSEIRNVGLLDISVTGSGQIGGLVRNNSGGIISACHATGSVTGAHGNDSIGGLVGSNSGGTVSTSYAAVDVASGDRSHRIGGLVGGNWGGTVSASYAAGPVSGGGSSHRIGGLVGHNLFEGTISASYATGSVTGGNNSYRIGGLVGHIQESSISASYATGSVSRGISGHSIGGLGGSNFFEGTISASYWDTETSGQSTSRGGVGKTTSELQEPTGYSGIYSEWNLDLDGDGQADDPWDFGTSSQYPTLKNVGAQ